MAIPEATLESRHTTRLTAPELSSRPSRSSRAMSRHHSSSSHHHRSSNSSSSSSSPSSRGITTPSHRLLALHHKPFGDLTESDIRKYLSDVPHEMILDCLVEACLSDDALFDAFDEYALHDPTKTRIFIRGLNYDTTKESLADAFKRFGGICDSTVIYDKGSNRSKGYGFITFSNSVEADEACRLGQLEVDNRRTQISLATPLRNRYAREVEKSRDGDRSSRKDDRDRSGGGRRGDQGRRRDEGRRRGRSRERSRSRSRDRSRRGRDSRSGGGKRRSDGGRRDVPDARNDRMGAARSRSARSGERRPREYDTAGARGMPQYPVSGYGAAYAYDGAAYAAAYGGQAAYVPVPPPPPQQTGGGSSGGGQPAGYGAQYHGYNPYYAGK